MPRLAPLACFLLLALPCALGVAPRAQQQPAAPFTAGVEAVRLDVRVVGADGGFVADIASDELRVFEDGAEQTITAFSKIELAPAMTSVTASSDVSSNMAFRDGRVYLLVLDDVRIHPQREVTVRQLARRFVEHYMTPADRVAIVTTSGIGLTSQTFTNNKAFLLRAIEQYRGRVLPEGVTENMPAIDAARATEKFRLPPATNRPQDVLPLQSLLSSVEWLGTIADRRKALVLISEGVPPRSLDPGVESTHVEILSAASRANVAIYSVDAYGLPTGPSGAVKPVVVAMDDPISEGRRQLRAGLMRLADGTGGASVTGSNAFDELFARVVADSSSYYMIGYTSTHGPSRKLRSLDVRVTRPGLRAQVRQSYASETSAAPRRSMPLAGMPQPIAAALQSPVPMPGVALSVTAAARRGSGDRASVAVIVEGEGTRAMDLFIGAADAAGKMETIKRGSLQPANRGDDDALTRATATVDLKPGRYQLRIAASSRDAATIGSVHHDIEVPDFSKEPLSIGALVLIDNHRGRVPTTRRTFDAGASIDVGAEIYWRRGLKQPVTVATSLVSGTNAVVYRQEGTVDAAQRPSSGVDLGVTIDLARYPAGPYQLVVEARIPGDTPLLVTREIPILVRGK